MSALTERQRHFADGVLAGLDQAAAYRAAGFRCANGNVAQSKASRMMEYPQVREYLSEMRERVAARVVEEVVVTKADVLRGLKREAEREEDGASHGARVSAWTAIGKALGMFEPKTSDKTDSLTTLPIDLRDTNTTDDTAGAHRA